MSLLKSFLRAVVSQIGRDMGRQISRGMYQSNYNHNLLSDNFYYHNIVEDIDYCEAEQEKIDTRYDVFKYIFAVYICLMFFGVGTIFFLVYGIIKYNKNTIKQVIYEKKFVNRPDRRYRLGYRVDVMDIPRKISIPASKENKTIYKRKGIIYIVISIVSVLIYKIIFNYY